MKRDIEVSRGPRTSMPFSRSDARYTLYREGIAYLAGDHESLDAAAQRQAGTNRCNDKQEETGFWSTVRSKTESRSRPVILRERAWR